MNTLRFLPSFGAVLAAFVLFLTSAITRADGWHVDLDTGALNNQGGFYLDFQLTDGTLSGLGNSTITLSNFQFTGGLLTNTLAPLGNVTGSLPNTLTLTDGSGAANAVAEYTQGIFVSDPDSHINFDLDLSAFGINAPTPDRFSIAFLTGSGFPLPTSGPNGIEIVSADFESPHPPLTGYSEGIYGVTATVTSQTVAGVPEPNGTAIMGVLFILGSLLAARKFKRSAQPRLTASRPMPQDK